ncbi:MAG: signal peptidase II [Lachnospiraceae bacterium]|nr:signal peptidase II [Lachnospiraceae bacterium]
MKYLKAVIGIAVLITLDQLTKFLAYTRLRGTDGIDIIKGVLRLEYLENRGSAFGLMQNQKVFFIIFTVIVLAVMAFIYARVPETKRMASLRAVLIMLFAGAVGNFIDRLVHTFVIDFIYFEIIDFPIFNVADICVSIGAVLLVVLMIFYYKDEDLSFLRKKGAEEKKAEDDNAGA